LLLLGILVGGAVLGPTNVYLGSLFCRPVGSGLLISSWVVAALNLAAAALAFCALRVRHKLFYAL
jgi:hypothetical protein